MRKVFVLTTVAMGLFFMVSSGFSEQKKSPIFLEQMVVTANRIPEKKLEVTSNITIITEKEIRMSSAKDLGELLAEKGIGHIHKYPGSLTSVGIRGFRTETHGNDLESHVLILLDGRRAGTGNLSKILTKNIERIEIIRGPASVQYGSSAIGGVINIITKKGKGKPKAFLDGLFGSFGYEEGTVGFSGAKKGFDLSVTVTMNKMDDYRTEDGKYHNTGYDKKQYISLNAGYEFLPKNRISILYHYFKTDHQGDPEYFRQNDLDDYTDKRNESVDIVYDGAIGEKDFLSWRIRYFNGQDKDRWVDPVGSNPTLWDDGIPARQTTDQEGAQAQTTLNIWNTTFTAGFDWVNYEVKTSWDPKKTTYDNPACFFLLKQRFFDDKVIFSGGIRYDHYTVKVKRGQGRKEEDDYVSPRFGIAFIPTDYIKLRANYGEGFMMPSAQQLSADYVVWGTHYKGNPDLDPEKSETYEFGFDLFYKSFSGSFTYFHTRFKDEIQSRFSPLGYMTWENIGSAVVEGIEGEFSYDIAEQMGWGFSLKPYVSFVYLTRYEDESTDDDLLYVSDTHVNYGITLSDLYGFSARLNIAYTGKQTIQDWTQGWPAPIVEKGGFTVVDLTITKEIFKTRYGKFSLRGEIRNLLDKDYEYVKGYPMPERSFFVGIRYEI